MESCLGRSLNRFVTLSIIAYPNILLFLCILTFAALALPGDVLQLTVPLRGADLLPGTLATPGGLHGWDSTHVHAQGTAHSWSQCLFFGVFFVFFLVQQKATLGSFLEKMIKESIYRNKEQFLK